MTTLVSLASGIKIVTTKEVANYPFLVEVQSTENWNALAASVTLDAADKRAQAVREGYPKLPVRVHHFNGGPQVTDHLPVYRIRQGGELPHAVALWSGSDEPPARGARVEVSVNSLGTGEVVGYFVEGGYLGVMVRFDEATRPEWHRRQNPNNDPARVFGAELVS